MGFLLDAALVALAVLVCGTLGMLAWTLGVTGLQSVRHERSRVAEMRVRLTDAARGLPSRSDAAAAVLGRISRRLRGD